MKPSGASGRRVGETPATQSRSGEKPSSALLPPSTAIRSRFRNITQQPQLARGTKRFLADDSPDGILSLKPSSSQLSWLNSHETPIRAGNLGAPLVDTILRPQRLFSFGSPTSDTKTSPARSILESTQRGTEYVGRIEALRREAERAKFELQQVELEREKDRDEALQIKQKLEHSLLEQTKRVEKLERERKWLVEQEDRLEEQRKAIESEQAVQRQKYERKIDKITEAAYELQERLQTAKQQLHTTQSEHAKQLLDQQERLAAAERTIAELQVQKNGEARVDTALQYTVDSLRKDVEAKDRDIADLQQQLQRLSGSDEPASPSQTRIVRLERDLQEQCNYIRAIEQQNKQLRAESRRLSELAASYEQERETRVSLEAKVQRLEAQQCGYAAMEAQIKAMEQEREQWARVFQGADPSPKDETAASSPYAVAKLVASQRQTIQTLEAKVETLQAEVEAAAKQAQKAASDVDQHRQERQRLEQDLAAEKQQTFRLKNTCQHAEREAAFLRDQLHSYDSEEASLMKGNYDEQKAERIRQLEAFIDEQRSWIASTDQGTPHADSGVSKALLQSYREDAEQKQKELEAAKHEYELLMKRFEELEQETARLEHQVGAGLGYNPRTTRVLQLIDNPAARDFAIRSEKLTALTAENQALLERIRQLEQSGGAQPAVSSGDAEDTQSPFFHTIDNLRTENQSLTKQLEDSAKLISRLKREWKKKVAELREVVYAVLGYRVDFLSNGSVRFTSMYAANVDQSFVFTSGDGDQGVMNLLGGGSKSYLQGLRNDICYWVQERGSIPGFMATITLQNFEAKA
ncbi:coiled-coil domain-containing protein mad1 [Coemansia sp. RSA 990]|nr:spindle assembly checkpoint component Mad1 [Coemansia mojavensis]KAJ1747011.1 coiled-coil domain-containing protein mad1 [Coemansia sp. RSA 1821]KAJ1869080.1 coiled-coil domain-containing protein mad1 [Coemansia sp. RSA 990]